MVYIVKKMENRDPWYDELVAAFNENTQAEEYINKKIAELKAAKQLYKGWDGETYPQFRIETVEGHLDTPELNVAIKVIEDKIKTLTAKKDELENQVKDLEKKKHFNPKLKAAYEYKWAQRYQCLYRIGTCEESEDAKKLEKSTSKFGNNFEVITYEVVGDAGASYVITFYDKETKVMYLCYKSKVYYGYTSTITVLLNADGTPKLYEEGN